jgi:hypothetical protein
MIMFTIFSVFGLAILLPINSVNQGDNRGLEIFTIGNIRDTKRLWTHVILTWLFSGMTFKCYKCYNYLKIIIT